ncbi:MAG: type 2 lanthipeptide synthetase LanM [Defluviitaleaceae bacterium]|nr:type 2 lanthipeptide synthetase LanM [Defluviitaleaceae bacterium]
MEEKFKPLVKALLTTEKIEALKSSPISSNLDVDSVIHEWISLKSLVSREDFEKRLEIEKINKREFSQAIKSTEDEDKQDLLFNYLKEMTWFMKFEEMASLLRENDETIKSQNKFEINEFYIVRMYLYYAENKLQNQIKSLKNVAISEDVLNKLLTNCMLKVYNLYLKVLILKLHGHKEHYELEGENGEEKFVDFLKKTFSKADDLIDFYLAYPVFTRSAVVTLEYSLEFFITFLSHIDEEYENLKVLCGSELNILKDIDVSAGDTHEKGKTVVILEFEDVKILYKPRDLRIVRSYNEFIHWVNEASGLLDMTSISGIYRKNYAFERFIENKPCIDENQIKNYYTRFGQLVAIAHLLVANDMHLENLIANGEYPILIDLETIIQGELALKLEIESEIDKLKVSNHLESVKNTLLLPVIAFSNNKEGKGIDLSALDGKEVKLPFKVLLPTNVGTDSFKLEHQEYIRPGAKNLPKLGNEDVTFIAYRENLLNGFKDMMTFFLNKKNDLLSKESQLKIFKNQKVRNVLKNTQKYMDLLNYANHPNYGVDMLKKEKLIENIWSFPHQDKSIIKDEFEDLLFNDIPVFFSVTDKKYLLGSRGDKFLNFFEKSGYEKIFNRIENLTESEINKQVAIMSVSLGFYEESIRKLEGERFYNDLEISESYDLLLEARKIGDFFLEQAIYLDSKSKITFIDVIKNKIQQEAWEVEPLHHDLDLGLSGIAFFLFELYMLTKEDKYFATYERIMRSAIYEVGFITNFDVLDGKFSIVFPILNELYKTGKSNFKLQCIEILNELQEITQDDLFKDRLSNCQGLVSLLVHASDVLQDTSYLDLANKIIEKIMTIELRQRVGVVGGLSGIALDTYSIYRKTRNEELLIFIKKVLDIEDLTIVELEKSREIKSSEVITASLARILLSKEINRDGLQLIEKSIETVYQKMKNTDALEGGNMGDIELLLQYDQVNCNMIDKKIKRILFEKEERKQYRIACLDQFVALGLFNGLSGIGYQMLRIIAPNQVSQVLTYELLK